MTARLFAPDSPWNTALARDAPLDPRSQELAGGLAREVAREIEAGVGPWMNTTRYSTPLYVVGPAHAEVTVVIDGGPQRGGVPLPPDARPADGTDGHLTVWQPATDRLWEFWRLRRERDGRWAAGAVAAIDRVSGHPGHLEPADCLHPWWGATASGLPAIAGTVLVEEGRAGRIDHALALAVPEPRAGTWAWPATRTDGSGGPGTLPLGARLRLDPSLDLDALRLPPVVRMLADAAQRYGMILRDRTRSVVVLYGEDPRGERQDPWPPLFDGRPVHELLSAFPWDHLQLLRMRLG